MEKILNLDSWEQLLCEIHRLKNEVPASQIQSGSGPSHLLFRGQASHAWKLETTLDRASAQVTDLSEYYRIAAIAKTRIETFTDRLWPEIDYPSIKNSLADYDSLSFKTIPHYDYLIYLRHHGFPSPLLDWSRSLYIAAFFACNQPVGDRVAIFVYQERTDVGKLMSSVEPQLKVLGPNVRSHPRHFLQQGEYTACVQYTDRQWQLGRHAAVFELNRIGQDRLWKLTLPRSEASRIMSKLEEYNITAFSLFQTEESLLQSLARSHLPQIPSEVQPSRRDEVKNTYPREVQKCPI